MEAIIRLDEKITSMAGEIVAIKDRLNNLKNVYISKEKESTFATKSQVNNISSKVNGIINTITGMDIDASGFATKDEIPTKVSQLKNDKGYLTEHQSLKDYAKKSDLPNFDQFVRFDDIDTQLSDELATKEWVNSKGFLTEHQSLADYAKKSNVYNKGEADRLFLSENEASMLYPSKVEADKKYLSKSDANKEYLKIEDYRGLKDATIISDKYKDNSIDDFLKDVDKLMNGFYIVNEIDVVVVKDHKVLHIYSGNEQKLVWQEE